MKNDYRRAKRRKASHPIDVFDTMTEQIIGRLNNLSETGMLLIAHNPLVSDALYQVRLRLPLADGDEHDVEIGAHELWSDEAAAPGQVWTGFRFLDVSPADLDLIRAWVNAPGSQYV